MKEYEISFTTRMPVMGQIVSGRGEHRIHAKDRADAIKFIKQTYRGSKPKVTSAKETKASKIEQKILKKAVVQVASMLTEAEAIEKMLTAASDKVVANPYDGKAIGKYLSLFMTTKPLPHKVRQTVEWIIREVENHNEKFIQRKY